MKMYYEEFLLEADCSTDKAKEQMEKAMEQVRKDHSSTFCKHLFVCNPALGTNFFKEIQVHYDMNSKSKMLIEKLQMLTYMCVSLERKIIWLKQWNESSIF
jgi:hypothetical protein